MSTVLRIGLLTASFLSLIFVLCSAVKNKLNIHYAMIWILWGMMMVVISIFPEIIFIVTQLIGIEVPVNTVFLIMIFLLYCLSFYLFIKISKHNEEIINLNYEIAVLKKEVESLKWKDAEK